MTFLPAFKICVDAGTYSLMCSYNAYVHRIHVATTINYVQVLRISKKQSLVFTWLHYKPYIHTCLFSSINGIPACANKELLTDIPRGEWGFKGYIVSDSRKSFVSSMCLEVVLQQKIVISTQ